MEIIKGIHSWRTVRSFRAEPLDRSEIQDLLWHAVQVSTPPGNEEPWSFCVMEGVSRIDVLGNRALEYAREHRPPGETGWSWVDRPGFRVFWGAPAVIVMLAQKGNSQAPFDCHRAGQNLVLAAHACGLGTCWLGAPLPWLRSADAAAEIGLPQGFEPTVVIAIGRPSLTPEPKARPRPAVTWYPAN